VLSETQRQRELFLTRVLIWQRSQPSVESSRHQTFDPCIAMLNCDSQSRFVRDCRSVELRALCDEVPRTPPGPEGSNGTGNASCAADHPEFLSPSRRVSGFQGLSLQALW